MEGIKKKGKNSFRFPFKEQNPSGDEGGGKRRRIPAGDEELVLVLRRDVGKWSTVKQHLCLISKSLLERLPCGRHTELSILFKGLNLQSTRPESRVAEVLAHAFTIQCVISENVFDSFTLPLTDPY